MHIKESSITWLDPTTNINDISGVVNDAPTASFLATRFLTIAILII